MSNTESRTRGVAQRALALLMALVLAITLTPSFALAEETNTAAANSVAEQSAGAGTTEGAAVGESKAISDAASASKVDASISADKQAEATSASTGSEAKAATTSNASDAANSNAPKPADQAATAPAATSGNKPAEQSDSAKGEVVTATLKISTHIGTPISKSFTIEKGKTVEDLLNLAVQQGVIAGYTHGDPYPGYTSYYISSITIGKTEYAPTSDTGFYWASSINSGWDNTGINETTIDENGFSYELDYVTWMTPEATQYPVDKDAAHPDNASENDTTAVIGSNGNTSAVASAPTAGNSAKLNWKKTYGNGNYSEILSIGDSLYFASSLYGTNWDAQTAVLHRINSKGEETASLQLFGSIDSTCRMVYTDGVIVIPLSNGRLQGVSMSEMKTMWVSDAVASGAQSVSTVTAANGMVFTGTANSLDSNYMANAGTFFGINAITGERVWANEETDTGFYWAGACKVGNVLLYGNDAGTLTAVDPTTGKTVSFLKLSSAIRSTVIANNAGSAAYVTTNDGTLHKITVGIDGSLAEANSTAFGAKSTSTATLFEGNLFIGGCTSDWKGCLSANTMKVVNTVTLPFEVKSTPLVAKATDGKTYAYFTCNGAEGDYPEYTSGGGAWIYCLETNTVAKLFDATGSMANYCTKSITMGADGTLYWTNDSGTLFALVNAASQSSSGGSDNSNSQNTTEPESNGNKAGGSNSNGSNDGNNNGGHASATSPINTAKGSAAAQAPLSSEGSDEADDDASAEDDSFGVEPTSASSARNASSDNTASEQQIPWLPITGIAVGCAGLIGVGVYLFRRRSL